MEKLRVAAASSGRRQTPQRKKRGATFVPTAVQNTGETAGKEVATLDNGCCVDEKMVTDEARDSCEKPSVDVASFDSYAADENTRSKTSGVGRERGSGQNFCNSSRSGVRVGTKGSGVRQITRERQNDILTSTASRNCDGGYGGGGRNNKDARARRKAKERARKSSRALARNDCRDASAPLPVLLLPGASTQDPNTCFVQQAIDDPCIDACDVLIPERPLHAGEEEHVSDASASDTVVV